MNAKFVVTVLMKETIEARDNMAYSEPTLIMESYVIEHPREEGAVEIGVGRATLAYQDHHFVNYVVVKV